MTFQKKKKQKKNVLDHVYLLSARRDVVKEDRSGWFCAVSEAVLLVRNIA